MIEEPAAAAGAGSWVSAGQFSDVDAQAAQYHGYGQQYQQLSRGPFEGEFRSFRFGDELTICFETANRAIAASAATPSGRFGVCFLANSSPPCALNATAFSQDHVILTPANGSVEGKMSAGIGIYCMDIARALLPEHGQDIRLAGVLSDPTHVRNLRELVQSGLSSFMALGSPPSYPAAVRGFKSSLADLLWQMADRRESSESAGTRGHGNSRTLIVFRRAREFIHHHLSDGISIGDLCKHVAVSRRSLEGVFHSVIGMGPASFIRILQLNRIRRDLLCESGENVSIGVIAARHGIWHWSRFSRYYRLMFGELPSQTRQRHASRLPRQEGRGDAVPNTDPRLITVAAR